MEGLSKAKYILRCDDAAEHMNIEMWERVMSLCDKYDVKPLIGVIPNVQDEDLLQYDRISKFWNKVREWNLKGYEIAIHGYSHVYSSRKSGLITQRRKSEFSGLSFKEQNDKIRKSLRIFRKQGLKPSIFIAPGHNFDSTTIKVLIDNDIQTISDGFFRIPSLYKGINWIPQQLWKGVKKDYGVWTICTHPNTMQMDEFYELEKFLENRSKDFITCGDCAYRKSNQEIMHHNFVVMKRRLYFISRELYKQIIKLF